MDMLCLGPMPTYDRLCSFQCVLTVNAQRQVHGQAASATQPLPQPAPSLPALSAGMPAPGGIPFLGLPQLNGASVERPKQRTKAAASRDRKLQRLSKQQQQQHSPLAAMPFPGPHLQPAMPSQDLDETQAGFALAQAQNNLAALLQPPQLQSQGLPAQLQPGASLPQPGVPALGQQLPQQLWAAPQIVSAADVPMHIPPQQQPQQQSMPGLEQQQRLPQQLPPTSGVGSGGLQALESFSDMAADMLEGTGQAPAIGAESAGPEGSTAGSGAMPSGQPWMKWEGTFATLNGETLIRLDATRAPA